MFKTKLDRQVAAVLANVLRCPIIEARDPIYENNCYKAKIALNEGVLVTLLQTSEEFPVEYVGILAVDTIANMLGQDLRHFKIDISKEPLTSDIFPPATSWTQLNCSVDLNTGIINVVLAWKTVEG